MDSLGLKDAFRSDVDDNVSPFFWSDVEVASYADDAQKMFCRLTNGIADSSSTLCTVDIDAGEPFASIDKRILKVRRLQRDSDARPLRVVSMEEMDGLGIRLDNQLGTVSYAVTGMEDHKLRWVYVPKVSDTASMSVFRLPLRDITVAKSILEIDAQHHRALLLWMKHLAYSKQDSETFNPKAAQDNELAFNRYCAQAKAEQDRAVSKIRVVRYGGI
jgi:hypothetical protein